MRGVIGRLRSLPRSVRWALAAAAGLIAYFGVIEPALDARARHAARAQSLEARLEALTSPVSPLADDMRTVARGRALFGYVLPPAPEPERSAALNARVLGLLESRGVLEHSSRSRAVPLRADETAGLAAPGGQVQRLIMDLEFEATPEQATAVIADLERAPEVTAVSSVALRRSGDGSRTVRASIALETWVVSRPEGRR